MKKIPIYFTIVFLLTFLTGRAFAAMAKGTLEGKTHTITSVNGRYSLEVKWLHDENLKRLVSQCTFREGSRVLWSTVFPFWWRGGNIDDNGRVIILVNYEAESSARGFSIYNRKGELIKEAYFDKEKYDNRDVALSRIMEGIKGYYDSYLVPLPVVCGMACGLVKIEKTAISPDGAYYVLCGWYGSEGVREFKLTLYDVKSGRLLWSKRYDSELWPPKVTSLFSKALRISPDNKFILFAAEEPYSHGDKDYFLFDLKGNHIWEKRIPCAKKAADNVEWVAFIDNGQGFKIFSEKDGEYLFFTIDRDGRVVEVSGESR